ncbi:MAG: flagellar basal body rod modification protein [Candidatus Latescibacteria bacterium ADurb.Bin168]|nr:MAG: flagellar basal body rod modification protein [Candidatus Latescibacteria bacterium ADurb.Bin168]
MWSYFSGDRYRPQFFAEGAHYKPAPLDTIKYDSIASRVTLRRMSILGDTTVADTTAFLGARLVRIVPDGSAGGVVISVRGTDTYAGKWALRVAVAYPDVVTYMPVEKDSRTGEMSVSITGANWQNAQDILLVAANDAISGTKIPFVYRVQYLHPETVAAPAVHRFELGQNLPNPFNPATVIPFTIEETAAVDLVVYDVQGRVVRRLVSGAVLEPGAHRVTWDGMTETGLPAGAGVYVVRLSAGSEMRVRRMTLLR